MNVSPKIPVVGLFLAIAFALWSGSDACAADPSGWWQSSSGSRIYISSNRDGVIVAVESVDGRSSTYRGRWIQPPVSFEYFTPQRGVRKVVMDSRNPNVLHVFSQDHRNVDWVRLQGGEPRPPHPPGGNPVRSFPPLNGPPEPEPHHVPPGDDYASRRPAPVDGVWRTASGDSFLVSTTDMRVSVTVIDPRGRRIAANSWWLVEGARFAYSLPDRPGVTECELDPTNPARMRASKNGRVTWWERIR